MKAKLVFLLLVAFASTQAIGQGYHNPYVKVGSFIKLPEGREAGAVGDVDIDPNGEDIWVIVRCEGPDNFGSECLDSNLEPILKINQNGEVVRSFGREKSGWVHHFVRLPDGDPRKTQIQGAEIMAIDKFGNMYGGEPRLLKLKST